MNIRQMEMADADQASRVIEQLGHGSSQEQVEKRLAQVQESPLEELYVCEESGELLGVMAFRTRENIEDLTRYGEISLLVVDEHARRRGVGRELMAFAEKRARELGCIGNWLVTDLDREDEAHKFYQSLGFSANGLRFVRRFQD